MRHNFYYHGQSKANLMPLVTSIVTCAKKTSQFFHSAVTGTRGVKEEGLKGCKGVVLEKGKEPWLTPSFRDLWGS